MTRFSLLWDFYIALAVCVRQLCCSTGYVMMAEQKTISGREECRAAPRRLSWRGWISGLCSSFRTPPFACARLAQVLHSLVSYEVDPFLHAPFRGAKSKRDVESEKNSRWPPTDTSSRLNTEQQCSACTRGWPALDLARPPFIRTPAGSWRQTLL